jgi:hypothetical protein
MEALKKMSAKSILGNVKRYIPINADRDIIEGEKVHLFRVYGVARGTKKGESDNGPWVGFLGEFRAERVNKDGEVEIFGSANLFLPACAQDLLQPAVESGDGVQGVEFAFDIGLVGRQSSSVGYEFTATTLLAVKESDAISPLKAQLPPPKWAQQAALAAPNIPHEGENGNAGQKPEVDKASTPTPATGKGKKQTAEATA